MTQIGKETWCYWKISDDLLIHSADPQTRPVVIIVFIHGSVRPSVLTFQNIAKQNKCRVKIMIATSGTLGLAEGIIDDTCLVSIFFCFAALLLRFRIIRFKHSFVLMDGPPVMVYHQIIHFSKHSTNMNELRDDLSGLDVNHVCSRIRRVNTHY